MGSRPQRRVGPPDDHAYRAGDSMAFMVTVRTGRRVLLGRHVAAAYAVLTGLYLVRYVGFRPFQLPAYLLIVAYDFLEVALPVIGPYHPVGFPLFLYLLAVAAAGVTRRTGSAGPDVDWGRSAGGVSLVVAGISLLFAAAVGGPLVSATDPPTPLAIAATAGVLFGVVGWGLLRGRSP